MPRKKRAGMTLLELIVAIALMMIVIAPILGVFVAATRLNSAAIRKNAASVTAQMRMEELVGLTEEELDAEAGLVKHYNGFDVEARKTQDDYAGFASLVEVTVTVFESDGTVLCTLTDILNVARGGII